MTNAQAEPPTFESLQRTIQTFRERLAADDFTAENGTAICGEIIELFIDCRTALVRAGLLYQLGGYIDQANEERNGFVLFQRSHQPEYAWRALVLAVDAIGECIAHAARPLSPQGATPAPSPAADLTALRPLLPQLAQLRKEALAREWKNDQGSRALALVKGFLRFAVLAGLLNRASLVLRAKKELGCGPTTVTLFIVTECLNRFVELLGAELPSE